MYSTVSDQYIPPGSDMADNDVEDGGGGTVLGGGQTEVVYYNQYDESWGNIKYGKTGTISSSGCGPTSLAIVVSTLTGKDVTPPMVTKWSAENGYRCEGNGSYHSLIPKGGQHYGLKVQKLGRSSKSELIKLLSNGTLIIVIMSKGHFTNGGHFIVLRGITESGKVLVADPAGRKRTNQEWDISIILNEARGDASAGGPFWALSK
ncbi:MAG: C39 family peptidase [Firmicutes bacterium]|nr:C39 family peptidase [Bacillota bacterium]